MKILFTPTILKLTIVRLEIKQNEKNPHIRKMSNVAEKW